MRRIRRSFIFEYSYLPILICSHEFTRLFFQFGNRFEGLLILPANSIKLQIPL